MNEEKNLLQDIIEENSKNDYHFAVILTYQFKLRFFEDYLIRYLPKDIYLLIDENVYDDNVKKNPPSSKFLNQFKNKRIKINGSRGVFHPKLLLFYGEEKCCCYILSANLTKSGYTHNLELVSKFYDFDIILQVVQILRKILKNCKGTATRDLMKKLINFKKWEKEEMSTEHQIFSNESEPLISQFSDCIKNMKFKEFYVSSPYLDNNPQDIIDTLGRLKVEKRYFILQNNNYFTIEALKAFSVAKYDFLLFENVRFLHAKFLYLIGEESDYLLLGSANLTKQAMMKRFRQGNYELCALLKIPSDYFKESYLKFLELRDFENIHDLKYSTKEIAIPEYKNTPRIIETYIKNDKLTIEVFGDYKDYVIYIYNTQDELIKTLNIEECQIIEEDGFHKIIINFSFERDLYRIYLKKGDLTSKVSYFTTELKEFSIGNFSREIFGEDFQNINYPLLYKIAERQFYTIIGKITRLGPGTLRLPKLKQKYQRTLSDLFKLLQRGLKKIREYVENIISSDLEKESDNNLEENEDSYIIEDLITWEFEIILSLPLSNDYIEIKIELLEDFLFTIRELKKIKEFFNFNLKVWELLSLLIFYKNHIIMERRKNPVKLYSVMKKALIKFEEKSEELHKQLLSNLKHKFNLGLIKKIENDDYIDYESIEILTMILEVFSSFESQGLSFSNQSWFSLEDSNEIDNSFIKEQYKNKNFAFCPDCDTLLQLKSVKKTIFLYCPSCSHYYVI